MDVFKVHQELIDDYKSFTTSAEANVIPYALPFDKDHKQ
jgi:hypothetical protein